jgi:hypothetical protein
MTEPTIVCPACKAEIKLTESLAAPLVESTRLKYEARILQAEAEVRKREGALREQQAAIAKARESIDEEVAARLAVERGAIAAQEAGAEHSQNRASLYHRLNCAAKPSLAAASRTMALVEAIEIVKSVCTGWRGAPA